MDASHTELCRAVPSPRHRTPPGLVSSNGGSGLRGRRRGPATARRRAPRVATLLVVASAVTLGATAPDVVAHSIQQFLAQDDTQPPYRAVRRLEAENAGRKGWLQAETEYSPERGFRYRVTDEGGSGYLRTKVLRAVLEGESEVIARGETARSSLALSNYRFQPNGVDNEGLANVLISPRRRERVLVAGTMFLQPADGALVRLQGRLAKSPSFWLKDVDIVRRYATLEGAVVPVALDSTAKVRFLGAATLHMTYVYSSVNGRRVPPTKETR